MEIFGNPYYYPSPSSDVILYSDQPVTRSRRSVSQADIYALIVYLTSPVDPVSYSIFNDFFLVYREFISSMELYDILINRFNWCISEIKIEDNDKSKIGKIVLIRTFVLIRHGIMNHFVQDFLPNIELRLLLLEFLNKSYLNEHKIIKDCIINLKKVWIHCMKLTWDNVVFNEPVNIPSKHNSDDNTNSTVNNYGKLNDLWLEFIIKDISQLNKEIKRNSRLSISALQGLSSPDYRNQSVMSLYKNNENFQLNISSEYENNKKSSRHTPSMLLNPYNSFNYAAKVSSDRIPKYQHKNNDNNNINATTVTPISKNDDLIERPAKRKVSVISKLPSNMSPTIADLEYPRNSKIDKIIPPTPAKKIELILNTKYISEEEIVSTMEATDSGINHEETSVHINSRSSYTHNVMGPLGLLNKWKKNHLRSKKHEITSPYKKNSNQKDNLQIGNIVKPQMDTFIKYVISISSLENHDQNSNEIMNLGVSKFDILSARTIDEVEFLLHMENELLEKINRFNSGELSGTETVETVENEYEDNLNDIVDLKLPVNNFSAMDNLDMYQTVSTIAQSVISLSNTLNAPNNSNGDTIETAPFGSRRKVKSSIAAFFGQQNNSSRFILQNQGFNDVNLETSPLYIDGPQRLIFHSSSQDLSGRPDSSNSNIVNLTPTKISRSPCRNRSSSPLKQLLEDLEEAESKESSVENVQYPNKPINEGNNDINNVEYVVYDSDLSISNNDINDLYMDSQSDCGSGPNLRKKNSFNNLREFTFEENAKNRDSSINSKLVFNFSQPINNSLDVIANLYGTSNINDSSSMSEVSEVQQAKDEEGNILVADEEHQSSSIENNRNSVTVAAIRPASGRISLIKKNIEQTNRRKTTITTMPTIKINIRQTDFFQKDKMLQESEDQLKTLKKDVTQRDSETPSIATTALFTSRHNSPCKKGQAEEYMKESVHSRIRLSVQPSIQSIISDGTFSSYSTFESKPSERVSLRTKFQEGLNVKGGSTFETASTNKYIFEPMSEGLDDVSPLKNMEELKSKFLKKESTKLPNNMEVDQLSGAHTSPHAYISQAINEEALKNIADITDDTIQDNPLEVAMMKLEGTYAKVSDRLVTAESCLEISKLSKEVEMLNISPAVNIPKTPQEKRRSLLIQRRRQTVMNIPYTPLFVKKDGSLESSVQDMELIKPEAIQNLLAGYKIHDPNLLISNNKNHIPFILTYDSLSIARQMTLIEKELLSEIDWEDLLNLNIQYNGPSVTSWLQLLVQNENLSGVDLAIARFNLTVDWIVSEIAITKDIKLKRNTIQRFIHVAEHCRKFQNYNTLMQIVLALNSVVVQQFIEAWRLIEPGDLLVWEELKKIPSLDRNYLTIRKLLNNVDPLKGCIPFIVVYLSDLSLNAQKKTWIEQNKIINYNKFDTSVQIVKHFIQRVQWCKNYQIEVDHELLSKCIYLTTLPQDELQQLMSSYN